MSEDVAIRIIDGSTREEELYMYDREDRPYIVAQAENVALKALKELKSVREYLEPLRNYNTHNEHLEKLKELVSRS